MHTFTPASLTVLGTVLLMPGGGQDHTSPGIITRALALTDAGFEVPVVRSLDAVPRLLAGVDGPVGVMGVYAGAQRALTLLVAEARVTATVLTVAEPVAAPVGVRVDVLPIGQRDEALLADQVAWLVAELG